MKSKISNHNLHVRDTVGFFLTTNRISKKLFGKNRSLFFNRVIGRKIIDHYGGDEGHQIDRFTGNLGFGFIHYALILNIKPERILCIGSRKGFIPAICALACQENGKGHVDFVDAGYDIDDPKHWSGIGWWKKTNPIKHFQFLDINEFLSTYVITTKEYAQKYHKKYQYIYIDGDHSYEGVKYDYETFWPRLEKKGLMLFHDVVVRYDPALPEYGVWKFWNELLHSSKITIPLPQSGLGILQKS